MALDHNISPITEAHLDAIVQIETACQQFPWSRQQLLTSLQSDNRWGVFNENGALVGFAFVQLVLDEATLLNICVHPDSQGKGIGKFLLLHILSELEDNIVNSCFLEVRVSNRSAISLYKKLGFELVGVRPDYYPDVSGREDAKIFKKFLGE